MLDWGTVWPGIRSLITDLAAGASAALTSEAKRPYVSPIDQFQLTLRITNVQDVGEDEWRYVDAPPPNAGDILQGIYGLRRVVCQVRIEHYIAEDADWSIAVAERIRTGIYRTSSLSRLLALNCSLVENGPINNFSAPSNHDDHELGIAVFDFIFCGAFLVTDPVPTGFYNKVKITSHVQVTEGTDLPVPPNRVDQQFP